MSIKRVLIVLVLLINIFLILVVHLKNNDSVSSIDELEQAQTLNIQMKENIQSSFQNQGIRVKDLEISCIDDSLFVESLYETISQPCLIIYIPFSEEICISCVHYAITKVEYHFPDFNTRNNICIITSHYNPKIKSRIYKKEIYHLTKKDRGFDIPADKIILPHYLILDKNYFITSFFTPNILYPELTDEYLNSAKRILDNYR